MNEIIYILWDIILQYTKEIDISTIEYDGKNVVWFQIQIAISHFNISKKKHLRNLLVMKIFLTGKTINFLQCFIHFLCMNILFFLSQVVKDPNMI